MIRRARVIVPLVLLAVWGGTPTIAVAPTLQEATDNVFPALLGIASDGTDKHDQKAIRFGDYADPRIDAVDTIVVSEPEARRLLQAVGPLVSVATTQLMYLLN